MADSFQFELVSPEQLLLSEAVTAVNVPGAEGYFTVMAHHAPVMTTLKPGVVVATLESGAEQRIFVLGGFADVNENGFTLLAERATPVDQLDSAELDGQIRDAVDAGDSQRGDNATVRDGAAELPVVGDIGDKRSAGGGQHDCDVGSGEGDERRGNGKGHDPCAGGRDVVA